MKKIIYDITIIVIIIIIIIFNKLVTIAYFIEFF